jgi:hypothetical protein
MSQDGKLLLREVNDRIYEVLQGKGSEDGDFLCECGSRECRETIQITLREFAAIRVRDDWLVMRKHRRLKAAT